MDSTRGGHVDLRDDVVAVVDAGGRRHAGVVVVASMTVNDWMAIAICVAYGATCGWLGYMEGRSEQQ